MKTNGIKFLVRGISIWCLAAIFYFFDNLLQVSPGVMKPELSATFNLSGADLGILSSCYLWPYGLMQIPAGLLMDKVGPKKLFAIASLLCAIGCFLFASANVLEMAQIGRILIGTGASFAVVGCSKIAVVWFPANKFALLTGLMVSVGMFGSASGLATVNYIIQAIDWRHAMYYSSYAAISLSILMWLIVKDFPAINLSNHLPLKQIKVLKGLKKIIASKQIWIASIFAGLMFVPTIAFGGLWGTPYLVEGHSLNRDLAGCLVSLIFIGWVFGGPLYGWISDYLGLRNPLMYFANITTLIITIVLIYTKNLSVHEIGLLMFLLGFCSSGFILAFVVAKESNDHQLSGTAIGFINTINTFSVAALQWIIGKILDVTATNAVITNLGEKVFSYNNYQIALVSIPVCLIISLITLFMLKETHCKVL
ncbi:MAG: MFS transporter [Gammaproteobacteria bacterium]|jgi:sugar phosphate permease